MSEEANDDVSRTKLKILAAELINAWRIRSTPIGMKLFEDVAEMHAI